MSAAVPMIEATDLSRIYTRAAERVEAVKGVTARIEAGEMVAVTGESGSGKTTLLNLLACIDRPTAGRLALNGIDVAGLPEGRLTELRRETIGFVFQEFSLIRGLSLRANVALPLMFGGDGRRNAYVEELLDRMGLRDRTRFTPDQLSGGELQRAALARALVRKPRILLADEPTGNLDARNTRAVFDLLQEVSRELGLSVVLATHDEQLASRCGRVLQLVDGALAG